ncbi:AraC family transcriptional regulator [Nocardia sp. NBC_00508]|uniref:helix-turn-helix transcriptional regulator n=1 Tax=Nocardia sp. NBC_00508 TaxID=2975992 RepID=UPI002E8003F0|nr:AraC family transcriptional regulator [Nocardia sp. NBC_00508]WUD66841.1 AraC family transcriptional regulator [Nocardia sp. NBC_00508]
MQCYAVTASDSKSWTTIANGFVPMDYQYGDPDRWYSGLTVQESAVYRLLRWEQRGISTSFRTRTNIRHGPCDDFYWVVVPERGVYSVRYRDEVTRAHSGQAAVTALDDLCQIHIPLLSAYAIQLPRAELDHRAAPAERNMTIDLNSGLGRVAQAMIRSTHAEQANLSDREFNAICDRVAELLCLISLGDTHPQRAHHAQIAAQIRQYVRANVGRGDVRLPAVAHALGWSPRQLRSVLHHMGTTYRDVRREEALRAARDLLEDPAREEVPIQELAVRAGFSPAWFSAAFKTRFGETPRDFRRRRLAELAEPGG